MEETEYGFEFCYRLSFLGYLLKPPEGISMDQDDIIIFTSDNFVIIPTTYFIG